MRHTLLLVLGFAAAGAEAAPPCAVATPASRLEFTADQAGAPVTGRFTRFRAEICFDPADLAASRFDVTIQTASADSGDAERDAALASEDFFASERIPEARYRTGKLIAGKGGKFAAEGQLSLRGVTKPVPIAFSYARAADGTAKLDGEAKLSRLAFGVGQGDWTDTEWVGDEVIVRFRLALPAAGK